jgi:arylsulfatase A-like enzyme
MTTPSMLKSRGYYTAGIGKWRLGLGSQEKTDYDKPLRPGPTDHGFDYYFGIPASLDMDPYLYIENDHAVEKPTAHTDGKNAPRGVFWRGGGIAPHFQIEDVLPTLTGRAIRLIEERAAKPAQPFFLYLALTAPHTPWVPKPEFQSKSKAGIYGDFVAQVDDTLGRVLGALDKARLADNTLVIFTRQRSGLEAGRQGAVRASRQRQNGRARRPTSGMPDTAFRVSRDGRGRFRRAQSARSWSA